MILDHRADLYEACQRLCPIDPAYAYLPIEQGFNWFSCLGDARFEGLYLVVFRSVRRAAADPRYWRSTTTKPTRRLSRPAACCATSKAR